MLHGLTAAFIEKYWYQKLYQTIKKIKPLQSRLFEKLCKEMGSCHKSFLFHSKVRWLSRDTVLTRLVELREEVAIFLKGQSDYSK
ncbi:Zinc finger BED domain-containing protein 5, partial [Trichinella nelsoni]